MDDEFFRDGNRRDFNTRRAPHEVAEWPTLGRLWYMLWTNRNAFIAVFIATLIFSALLFRSREKVYRSIAIVSSSPLELANPVKEVGGQDLGAVDLSNFVFNQMKTSLFSFSLVKQAALDAGILQREMSKSSLRQEFSKVFWKLVGGNISSEEEALERTIIDKIRFERMTFEQLDRTKNDAMGTGGIFRITAEDENPAAGQKFLARVIELHGENLRKQEEEVNKKVSQFYDDQISFFAAQAEGSDSKIDFEGNRQRLQSINRMRSELDAKLLQESSIRSAADSKLSQMREELASAQSKYSAQHPEVVALKKAFEETSKTVNGPVERIRGEIAELRRRLDKEFSTLVEDSGATVEGSGTAGEGHTQYYTKNQAERRSLSKVYERVQERHFQALVQAKLNNMLSADRFKIVEPPSKPVRPDSPRLIPWLVASLVIAFGLALAGSLGREFIRPHVRDRWLVSRRTQQPVWAEQKIEADYLLEPEATLRHNDLDESHRKKGRRGFRRLLARGSARSDTAEVIDSLGALLAQLSANQMDSVTMFQCGIMPLSPHIPSATVAINLANLTSSRSKLKTLVVSFEHPLSLIHLLRLAPEKPGDDLFIHVADYNITVYDAGQKEPDAQMLEVFRQRGFQVIIWDLPPAEDAVWHALRLPLMPLAGIAEYGSNTYSEITQGALWLNLLSTRRGLQTGIYLTGSTSPAWLRLSEEVQIQKAA